MASQDLTPGTVIEAQHVDQVRMRLADEADWVVTSPEAVVGSVVLGPVGQNEFIQASNIAAGGPEAVPAGLAEVSIAIEASRAPARLDSGELVSILATFDDQDGARTTLILSLIHISEPTRPY